MEIINAIYMWEKIVLFILIIALISFKVGINVYASKKNIKDKLDVIRKNVIKQKSVKSLKNILILLIILSLTWIGTLIFGTVSLRLGYYISLIIIIFLWILFFLYSLFKEKEILKEIK